MIDSPSLASDQRERESRAKRWCWRSEKKLKKGRRKLDGKREENRKRDKKVKESKQHKADGERTRAKHAKKRQMSGDRAVPGILV